MEEIKIQSKAKAKDEASVSGASSLVSRGNSNLNRLPGLHGESARGGRESPFAFERSGFIRAKGAAPEEGKSCSDFPSSGAGDRTRTGTGLLPRDFKSLVSTIPPHRHFR